MGRDVTGQSRGESDVRAVESRQLAKYRFWYKPETLRAATVADDPYFAGQAAARIDEVRRGYRGGLAVDLCCGNGFYAVALAGELERVLGLDFSPEMVAAARARAQAAQCRNAGFCLANARCLPLADASAGLVYSFSSLYHIPAVEQVVAEVARVLGPRGVAVLDFGALRSLNTLVCRAAPETAEPCHRPLGEILDILRQCGLSVERRRVFQILPMWGNRPRWLRPLLHPGWKWLLSRTCRGRMLDEWISGLPLVQHFAFRHVLTCRKG
jgi:SAM-dependent methyltransferase